MLIKATKNFFIDNAMAKSIMDEFFATDFEGGRHQKRIDKIPVNQ